MAKNFLWFAEGDVEESQDALMVSADNFLHADTASGRVYLYFKDVEGNEAARETIALSCTNGNQKAIIEAFGRIMGSSPFGHGGLIVVADYNTANGQTAIGAHPEFRGLVTQCTIS